MQDRARAGFWAWAGWKDGRDAGRQLLRRLEWADRCWGLDPSQPILGMGATGLEWYRRDTAQSAIFKNMDEDDAHSRTGGAASMRTDGCGGGRATHSLNWRKISNNGPFQIDQNLNQKHSAGSRHASIDCASSGKGAVWIPKRTRTHQRPRHRLKLDAADGTCVQLGFAADRRRLKLLAVGAS